MIGFSRITPQQLEAAIAAKQNKSPKLDVIAEAPSPPSQAGVEFLLATSAAEQLTAIGGAAASHDHDERYYTQAQVDTLLAGVGGGSISAAWPVGSIFFSVLSTNPATLLGFGTWEAIGAGRVLIGQDTGDPDCATLKQEGGAKTVTLTEAQIPAHSHSVTDPGHTHVENSNNATTGGLRGWGAPDTSTNTSTATGYSTASATTGISLGNTGGGQAHANVPPYVIVKMWERTA